MTVTPQPAAAQAGTLRPPGSFFLVTSSYLPIIGGSEIEAQRICGYLQSQGWGVRILCPGGPEMPRTPRWIDSAGMPVESFGRIANARWRPYLFGAGSAWRLFRSHGEYQVAYFLMPGIQVLLGVIAARLRGKPVVMKFSGANEVCKLLRSPAGRLQIWVLRRWARRILLLNQDMFEEARQCGFHPARLEWMPNPVDTAEFAPADAATRVALRDRYGIPRDALVTAFVGRLAPEKQLASLLRGFAIARAAHPQARLVLAGDGPLRTELERLARTLHIEDRVTFAGRVAVDEVRSYLRLSDAFALVSSLEGFPVSLAEAMSTGLPSVVSSISANTQLVRDEVQGITVPVGCEAAIGAALDRLMADAALRGRMGQAARQEIVANYSLPMVARRYEELFAQVAGEGGRR
ncbi:MAG: glycosyltransferase family 4 protein [Bryobacteraceae bacterium]|nr:glycosyltransferase family 4 protein [Bryobacteraceae bacterium]